MLLSLLSFSLASLPLSMDGVQIRTGNVELVVSSSNGTFDITWGPHAQIRGAFGEARLRGGETLRTTSYLKHEIAQSPINDIFGRGTKVTLKHTRPDQPALHQTFTVYQNRPEVIVKLEIVSKKPVESNYLAPIVVQGAGVNLRAETPLRSLFVPFDNDNYVRYRSDNWADNTESCEVGAIYDEESRNGLVVGSLDHDRWKSGIQTHRKSNAEIHYLKAYAGSTNRYTHDTQPHGYLKGKVISSPRFTIGQYTDWRDGMERYGDLNALVQPLLPWKEGVPFGWNSWSGHKEKITAKEADAATEFFADEIPHFKNGGTAYINFDSFWDRLSREELAAFVKKCHAKGLKAGIYWTPFTYWGELDWKVDGGEVEFREYALKDHQGIPLPKLSGGYPMDPTYPGTKARNAKNYQTFVDLGFDFIKLDFMTHGALEGKFHDSAITTGIQAYRKGMQDLLDAFDPQKIGRPFFISLSIAPMFPHGYAHSRRISCDAFARIDQAEYMLNSATYSWWTHGRLYAFNDPDHSPLYRERGQRVTTDLEARSRWNASIIAGGMLLESDDLTDPAAKARVKEVIGNKHALDLARKAPAFRPAMTTNGYMATNVFVWKDGAATYVALFNYEATKPLELIVRAERLGLDPNRPYRMTNVWSNQSSEHQGALRWSLDKAESVILKLEAS